MKAPAAAEQPEATQAETGATLSPSRSIGGSDGLREALEVVGYVKVIATLKREPAQARPMALRASASVSSAQATESMLAAHFMLPGEMPAASLALSSRGLESRRAARASATPSRRVRVYSKLGLAVGYVDSTGLANLAADGHVQRVTKAPELSLIRPRASRPAKLGTQMSWGLKRLKIDRLWGAGYRGKDVVVGHLDTGVDGSHPALKNSIAAFAEFDLSGDQVAGAAPRDSDTHGTHTAGTIVGRSGPKGAFGVAPEAKLASAMVIEGGQVIDRILVGMEWLVDQGVRIMSMSVGLRGYDSSFEAIIDALRAANILPIIASGNEGENTSRSPGNYATVLSIGAMDSANSVADFSSSQYFSRSGDPVVPDLVAPGVGVLSCIPGKRYAEDDGTSMATPHIAGLAALLLQAKPTASTGELEQAILGSCSLPAGMKVGRGNRGVPDGVKALKLLTGITLSADAPAGPAAAAAPTGQRVARERRPASKKSNKRPGTGRRKPQKKQVAKAKGQTTKATRKVRG